MACAFLFSFLVPTTLAMFYFFSAAQSIPEGSDTHACKDQKVDLNLYYEALCPGCSDFIIDDLQKVFDTDLKTIVNLRLVPWGNAEVVNGSVSCQHGDNECYLNIIDACAIKAWPEVETHFAFIRCIESATSGTGMPVNDSEAAWRKCADDMRLPQEPIDRCYDSGEGKKLSLGYGYETDHLEPPHEFVPWVTVNKVALKDNFPDYIKYVCEAYKGNKPPKACNCKQQLSSSTSKETTVHPVCSSTNFPFLAAENSKASVPKPAE